MITIGICGFTTSGGVVAGTIVIALMYKYIRSNIDGCHNLVIVDFGLIDIGLNECDKKQCSLFSYHIISYLGVCPRGLVRKVTSTGG